MHYSTTIPLLFHLFPSLLPLPLAQPTNTTIPPATLPPIPDSALLIPNITSYALPGGNASLSVYLFQDELCDSETEVAEQALSYDVLNPEPIFAGLYLTRNLTGSEHLDFSMPTNRSRDACGEVVFSVNRTTGANLMGNGVDFGTAGWCNPVLATCLQFRAK